MSLSPGQLDWYEAVQSDDELKRPLELTCTRSEHAQDDEERVICDIEDGDTFATLVSLIEEHEQKHHA